jgi:hypothetical protein
MASSKISMASWPLVLNRRSGGMAVTRDSTESLMCSSGVHCRKPARICPVPSRIQAACTVLIPFETCPAHPMYCLLTPAVCSPFFSCPVSSRARIFWCLLRRPFLRAAASGPSAPNRRTALIAPDASHIA